MRPLRLLLCRGALSELGRYRDGSFGCAQRVTCRAMMRKACVTNHHCYQHHHQRRTSASSEHDSNLAEALLNGCVEFDSSSVVCSAFKQPGSGSRGPSMSKLLSSWTPGPAPLSCTPWKEPACRVYGSFSTPLPKCR
jgi:hypothetical protein